MRQWVFRVKQQQALCDRDCLVELSLLLQRPDEPVHGIEHSGIYFQAAAKGLYGARGVPFRETVKPLVIKFFRLGGG